ncbi:MAG: FecR family protein [Balneolaceae bacterium]|nr:FecR family protein [Balneolaceae bacterium]
MKNLNDISKQLGTWLKNLDPEERSGVEEVWQKTGQSDPAEKISLSTEEKQSALADIKGELKLEKEQTPHGNKKTEQEDSSPIAWRWLAMAAALLIAAATSYLFIPREHTAPYGEQVTVKLPDNSTVTLNSGSSLTYNRLFGYFHRNAELNGEAFFEVETGEEPFVVTTFNATVQVWGLN